MTNKINNTSIIKSLAFGVLGVLAIAGLSAVNAEAYTSISITDPYTCAGDITGTISGSTSDPSTIDVTVDLLQDSVVKKTYEPSLNSEYSFTITTPHVDVDAGTYTVRVTAEDGIDTDQITYTADITGTCSLGTTIRTGASNFVKENSFLTVSSVAVLAALGFSFRKAFKPTVQR